MAKKVYYRNTNTGDLGYLSEDGTKIVLDRPLESIERPFNEREWAIDKERRPLTRNQMAQIAFQADAQLCRLLGHHGVNKGQWQSLSDKERIAWVHEGPKKGIRKRLYDFVMEALAPLGAPR